MTVASHSLTARHGVTTAGELNRYAAFILTDLSSIMTDYISVISIVLAVVGIIMPNQKAIAQQSLTDIPREKRNALDLVMTFGDDERIAKENDMSDGRLSALKKDHGEDFMPFYAEGDFDGDGDEDFAIVHVKMGGVKDKDEEWRYPGDEYDDWETTISIFEADEEYARGFVPNTRVGWGGEKDKMINFLSRLFIDYDKYLYFCITGIKCEKAISVGN